MLGWGRRRGVAMRIVRTPCHTQSGRDAGTPDARRMLEGRNGALQAPSPPPASTGMTRTRTAHGAAREGPRDNRRQPSSGQGAAAGGEGGGGEGGTGPARGAGGVPEEARVHVHSCHTAGHVPAVTPMPSRPCRHVPPSRPCHHVPSTRVINGRCSTDTVLHAPRPPAAHAPCRFAGPVSRHSYPPSPRPPRLTVPRPPPPRHIPAPAPTQREPGGLKCRSHGGRAGVAAADDLVLAPHPEVPQRRLPCPPALVAPLPREPPGVRLPWPPRQSRRTPCAARTAPAGPRSRCCARDAAARGRTRGTGQREEREGTGPARREAGGMARAGAGRSGAVRGWGRGATRRRGAADTAGRSVGILRPAEERGRSAAIWRAVQVGAARAESCRAAAGREPPCRRGGRIFRTGRSWRRTCCAAGTRASPPPCNPPPPPPARQTSLALVALGLRVPATRGLAGPFRLQCPPTQPSAHVARLGLSGTTGRARSTVQRSVSLAGRRLVLLGCAALQSKGAHIAALSARSSGPPSLQLGCLACFVPEGLDARGDGSHAGRRHALPGPVRDRPALRGRARQPYTKFRFRNCDNFHPRSTFSLQHALQFLCESDVSVFEMVVSVYSKK